MSLEKIKERIMKDAERKVKEILKTAEEEKKKKIEAAESDIESKKEGIIKKGEAEAMLEKQRRISEAKISVKRKMAHAKDELVEEVLEKGRQEIEKLRKKKDYVAILERLIVEASNDLGGEEITVTVADGDKKLINVKKLEASAGKKVILKEGSIGPGAIVTDGNTVIDNTFAMRLEREKDAVRGEIAKKLFGK